MDYQKRLLSDYDGEKIDLLLKLRENSETIERLLRDYRETIERLLRDY